MPQVNVETLETIDDAFVKRWTIRIACRKLENYAFQIKRRRLSGEIVQEFQLSALSKVWKFIYEQFQNFKYSLLKQIQVVFAGET